MNGVVRHAGTGWRVAAARSAAVLLSLALLLAGCGGGGEDEEEDRPVSAAPRLTTEHGKTAVTLNAAPLSRSGIAAEALGPATHRASATAYGAVLDLTDLAEMRGTFITAAARLEKGRAALAASQAELERLSKLYADDRNASQKALQAATARAQADQSEVRAADGAVEAERALAGQRWGAVVAAWVERGGAPLEGLLAQKQRLIEITMPPGSPPPVPRTALTVRAGGAGLVEAHVVSPAPRADPRIQGASVLCTVAATPEMLPGMTVTAQVPVGPTSSGVVVPSAALVWWQGRAWVYVEIGEGTFARREVSTDAPVPGGWFVGTGLAPGDRVVVRGAQVLLSEEGRGAVRGSEG